MARLNNLVDDDSDGELPDLAEILHGIPRKSPSKIPESDVVAVRPINSIPRRTISASSNEEQTRKQHCQRVFDVTHIGSLLPLSTVSLSSTQNSHQDDNYDRRAQRLRSTPKRAANKPVNYGVFGSRRADGSLSGYEDDESFTDLSGFIVSDSGGDEEERPWKPRRKENKESSKKTNSHVRTSQQGQTRITLEKGKSRPEIINLSSPEENLRDAELLDSPIQVVSPANIKYLSAGSLNLDEPFSQLRFSPPRSRKPSKTQDFECLITPPTSPSKSRLESPSKKHRIPPSPHRPSIDAFWSQDVINDWNDEYSAKKNRRIPGRAGLLTLDEHDENHDAPSASPQRSPTKSPTKKDRQAAKAFNAEKSNLASTFLAELDDTVNNSQVSNLAAPTGGITIIWSKKLSSTAGRANWRREAIRHKKADGTYSETTFRHHASIELAEKVIDCKDRLINVLAHEYCHLANFMISGVKDQPHGKEFKAWAAKVTEEFRHRGVEVTTKHDYDISYKWIWSCGECGLEYKRHSKSIDPSKHSCGVCKGRLVQILPVPRKESEYQKFLKLNWDTFKGKIGKGAGMSEINALLAKEWDMRKARDGRGKENVEVAEVADEGHAEREKSSELDDVARKLDFLSLGNNSSV